MFDRARQSPHGSQIDEVLDEMRRLSHDSADLGSRFERLCLGVLGALTGGSGRRLFDRVDRWDDWAGRDGPAGGIDLVAHRSSDREDDAVAIQCHCYSDDRLVSKRDVGSFLTKSGSASFRARMLIHAAEGLSPDLRQQIEDRRKPCHVVDLAEMRRWRLDWWAVAEAVGAVSPPRPSPRRSAVGQPGDSDPGDTDPGHLAGSPLRKGGRPLLSRGIGFAAIAMGTFMVFSGAGIGALLIIGGFFVLARRRGTHRPTSPRPADRPHCGRRGSATSRHRPDSHDWSDDHPGWDDGGDRYDEWGSGDAGWDDADDESNSDDRWDDTDDESNSDDRWDDTDDEWDADHGWDWDDFESPRRSASPEHRTDRSRSRHPGPSHPESDPDPNC